MSVFKATIGSFFIWFYRVIQSSLMEITIPSPGDLKTILLQARGVSGEDAQAFLTPTYRLGDPFLFHDMEKAVQRLHRAIVGTEHIGIYADYDCDGIPGAVILLDLCKKIGIAERVHVYIPDRHDEGYGVSALGITELEKQGVSLMITVDVGITAVAEIADAQSRNIDVILTDHHAPLQMLPAAYAVVHPCKSDYPHKEPCGAVMAFHLVRAYLSRYGKEMQVPEGWEKWLLDLAGFATLSDMVPLTGENRMIASYGLMVMRKTRRVGLQVLFAKNNLYQQSITEQDLTFTVAPRLNAASRMDSPQLAFELLSTESLERATALAARLDQINNERKLLVAQIVKAADHSLAHRELPAIVVVGDLTWRPAVLGIVAAKLQEKYDRSFFVWGESGTGEIKGSCRMNPEHHAALLFQALPEEILIHAGGHQAAGGFSVHKEHIHFFEAALNDAISKVTHTAEAILEHAAIPLGLAATTVRHLQTVREFSPFGVGNQEPVFLFDTVSVESIKMFGKSKEHIECTIRDMTGTATAFTFFADKTLLEKIKPGNTMSFIGTLEAGWRGGVRIHIQSVN
jgi:single-stranded-DNA-specific exonuclease